MNIIINLALEDWTFGSFGFFTRPLISSFNQLLFAYIMAATNDRPAHLSENQRRQIILEALDQNSVQVMNQMKISHLIMIQIDLV